MSSAAETAVNKTATLRHHVGIACDHFEGRPSPFSEGDYRRKVTTFFNEKGVVFIISCEA